MLDDYSPLSVVAYSSRAVYYARSLDGGQSWTDLIAIDEVESRQEGKVLGPDWGNVAVDGEDRVHIVWVGSADMYRHHQWSGDGGVTWTAPQVMIPSGGYNGWQGLAVDAAGGLHVAWPSLKGLEYTCWDGNAWASPVLLTQVGAPHWAQAAVALGNQLHLVWQDHDGNLGLSKPGLIVHTMLQVDAPSIEPQPLPMPPVPAHPAATSLPTQVPRPTAAVPSPTAPRSVEPFVPISGTTMPALIGVVPAVLLVGLVLLLRLRNAR
jgi:hypothetical protein